MRDWTGPDWEAGRLLASGMIQPKGMVSLFSRFSGDMIDSVALARDEPEVVLGRIGDLVRKWVDAPEEALKLRTMDFRGGAGRRALTIGIVAARASAGPVFLKILLTERPSVAERFQGLMGQLRRR